MGKLEIFRGQLLTFITPSLNTVTIREQSAEDDDILGKISEGDLITPLNEFVASIVVSSSYETKLPDGALSVSDVLELPLRDKHYILLKSRLHSMGSKLIFEYEFPEAGKLELEEDLSIFDQDLGLESSTEIPEGKHENCITRYPRLKELTDYKKPFEIELSSGHRVRMTRMNGVSEKKLLEASKNKALTVNTEFFVRDLSVLNGDTWEKVTSMNIFSKREAIEIKKEVSQIDTQFTPLTHIKSPTTKEEEYVPVFGIKDFFFPTEI